MLKRTAVQSSPEHFRPYFVIDGHMRVQVWPDATARALGISEDQAKGRPCWELLDASAHCQVCRGEAVGPVPPANCCARLPVAAAGGGWLVWSPPTMISSGPTGSGLLESVLVRGALADSVAQCSLEDALEAVRRACAADDCELFLLQPGDREVTLRGCVGEHRETFLECIRMPVGVGYPGRITATGKPLYTDHFKSDRRFRRQAVKRCGIHTFIGVPLIEKGRTIGYLGMGWKDASIPLDWGVQLLQSICSIVPVAARRLAHSAPALAAPRAAAVHCFGSFAIVGERGTLDATAFSRRKALDLLRHLLLARGTALSRDALIERLWPDVDPDAGTNRLHVALHALRGLLSQAVPGASVALQHRHGCYRLDPDALGSVDVFEFIDALDEARRRARAKDVGGAITCLEQALPLYRGELFADAEDVAFEAPRQRYRDRYREGLRLLVDLYLRDGRADLAHAALIEARERHAEENDDGDWHDALLRQVSERC